MSEENSLRLYNCMVPRIQEHAYATGLKCEQCKIKREQNGVRDLPMTVQQMTTVTKFWEQK